MPSEIPEFGEGQPQVYQDPSIVSSVAAMMKRLVFLEHGWSVTIYPMTQETPPIIVFRRISGRTGQLPSGILLRPSSGNS